MKHYILFTGHMIDKPNRKHKRFPPEKEILVKNKIEEELTKMLVPSNIDLQGIAGGACGGDILFHEICFEMKIPSEIFLALPPDTFKAESVSFADKDWEDRFNILINGLPFRVLPETELNDTNLNVWQRANLWMLDNALKGGGANMSLIALWDGNAGDGKGGTEHMIQIANKNEAEIRIIDIKGL